MSIDMGEYDARKATPSSKEEQERVFAEHKERLAKLSVRQKLYDADGEVRVGDVVRYGNKPCFIEWILPEAKLVGVVTMDERHVFLKVRAEQIGCIFGEGEL